MLPKLQQGVVGARRENLASQAISSGLTSRGPPVRDRGEDREQDLPAVAEPAGPQEPALVLRGLPARVHKPLDQEEGGDGALLRGRPEQRPQQARAGAGHRRQGLLPAPQPAPPRPPQARLRGLQEAADPALGVQALLRPGGPAHKGGPPGLQQPHRLEDQHRVPRLPPLPPHLLRRAAGAHGPLPVPVDPRGHRAAGEGRGPHPAGHPPADHPHQECPPHQPPSTPASQKSSPSCSRPCSGWCSQAR